MELTGLLEGRYEILSRLGSGAFGEVYRALDRRLNRDVAIKRLRIETLSEESERRKAQTRFLQEARIAARLQHPNIVTVHDVVGTSELLFMVLELIEGETLQQRLYRYSSLDPFETLAILKPASEALDFANRAGVVHRDVKPANIMIDHKGNVKVADFGIAKIDNTSTLTGTGHLIGTPNYMSPEQARGEPVDHRSDIFSLGCVLFECLSGRKAFDGESITAILLKIVGNQPEKFDAVGIGLHQELAAVLDRALAHEKEQRFESASELVLALESATASTTHKSVAQVLEATMIASRRLAVEATVELTSEAGPFASSASGTQGTPPSSQEQESYASSSGPTQHLDLSRDSSARLSSHGTAPSWTRYWPLAIAALVLLLGISGGSLWLGRLMASQRTTVRQAASQASDGDTYVERGPAEADRESWQEGAGTDPGGGFGGGGFQDLEGLEVDRPDPTPRPQPGSPVTVEESPDRSSDRPARPRTRPLQDATDSEPTVSSDRSATAPAESSSAAATEPKPKAAPTAASARPGPGEEYRKTLEVRVGVELDVEPDETEISINGKVIGRAEDIDEDWAFDRPGTYSFKFTAPDRVTQWWLVEVNDGADDKWEDLEVDLKKIRKKRRR